MSQNWQVYSSLSAHQLINIFGIFMTQNGRFGLFSCVGYPPAPHWRHASNDTLMPSQQYQTYPHVSKMLNWAIVRVTRERTFGNLFPTESLGELVTAVIFAFFLRLYLRWIFSTSLRLLLPDDVKQLMFWYCLTMGCHHSNNNPTQNAHNNCCSSNTTRRQLAPTPRVRRRTFPD